MLSIRIRLNNIFTLAIQAHEAAIKCRIKHIRNTQTGFGIERNSPTRFEFSTRNAVRDMPITWQLMRERTHIA